MMGGMSGWEDEDMTAEEFDALLDAGEPARPRSRKRPSSVIRDFRIVSASHVVATSAVSATVSLAAQVVSEPRVTRGRNYIMSGSASA